MLSWPKPHGAGHRAQNQNLRANGPGRRYLAPAAALVIILARVFFLLLQGVFVCSLRGDKALGLFKR